LAPPAISAVFPSTSMEALSCADQSDCSWRAGRLGIPVRRRPFQLRVHSHDVVARALPTTTWTVRPPESMPAFVFLWSN